MIDYFKDQIQELAKEESQDEETVDTVIQNM